MSNRESEKLTPEEIAAGAITVLVVGAIELEFYRNTNITYVFKHNRLHQY